jgi:hypothetical protein
MVSARGNLYCGACKAFIPEDGRELMEVGVDNEIIVIHRAQNRVVHRCSTMYVIQELTLE